MATSLLQEPFDVTAQEFAESVFSFGGACESKAVCRTFLGILKSGSTLLDAIAHTFRPDEWRSRKEDRESVSRWLEQYSLLERVQSWMLERGAVSVGRDTGIAVDLCDISKPWGGKGMEGMSLGRDGSTHEIRMGHLFGVAAIVPNATTEARPVFAKLQKGKSGEFRLFRDVISTVKSATGGNGIFVMDRGCDASGFLWWMLENGIRGVVRVRDSKRDLLGTGRKIEEDFVLERGQEVRLVRLSGRPVRATVKWQIGHLPAPGKPRKIETVQYRKILVVESSFEGKTLHLLMTVPPEELDDRSALRKRASQAAQLYLNRWEIEVSFLRIKQDYGLEDARVRTFKRLENLFALCYLSYLFMHFHLPAARLYKRIVKVLRDNVGSTNLRADVLLRTLRDLLKVDKLRYIPGRPRTHRTRDDNPRQMELPLF